MSRAIVASVDDFLEDLWAIGDGVMDTQMDTALSSSILIPSRKSQKTNGAGAGVRTQMARRPGDSKLVLRDARDTSGKKLADFLGTASAIVFAGRFGSPVGKPAEGVRAARQRLSPCGSFDLLVGTAEAAGGADDGTLVDDCPRGTRSESRAS